MQGRHTERVVSTPINKKVKDVLKYSQNEKETRNYECYQQAILIALVNQICGITLQKPFKQATSVVSKPEIISLEFEDYSIKLRVLGAQQYSYLSEHMDHKEVKQKTEQRRVLKNRSHFAINFLFDMCLENGYFFNSKLSKKSSKCTQVERIIDIYFNGTLVFDKQAIIQRGSLINNYLLNLTKDRADYTIKKGDCTLLNYLFKPVELLTVHY